MEHNIKVNDKGVQLQYTKYGAGCMVFAMGIMTAASLFALYIASEYTQSRALIGTMIGIVGTFFFGSILLQLFSALLRGKVLLRIEDGCLMNHRHRIPLRDIEEISFGRHKKTWSGRVLEDVVVRTVRNETLFLKYYSLIADRKMSDFIDTYVIPHTSSACRAAWEKHSKKQGI